VPAGKLAALYETLAELGPDTAPADLLAALPSDDPALAQLASVILYHTVLGTYPTLTDMLEAAPLSTVLSSLLDDPAYELIFNRDNDILDGGRRGHTEGRAGPPAGTLSNKWQQAARRGA
jgi:hypothetical protein